MKTLSLQVVAIIVLVSNTYGQIKNYRHYQESINLAELNLIAGNQLKALNIYYDLLTTSDGNFSKDIYNSLILAKDLKRFDTLFVLLEFVKVKNFDTEYLKGLPEFADLHNNTKWKAFISTNNKRIYIDTALRSKINNLQTRDQFFRLKEGSYKVYGDTIKKIDSLNYDYIMSLLISGGFPGEQEIGAQDFFGNQGYDIVLYHYCQYRGQNKKVINPTPFLINQVLDGRIRPNMCAHILEMQNGEFKAGTVDVMRFQFENKYSEILVPDYTKQRKALIEEFRKWLCLEPLDDYFKKVKFVINVNNKKYKIDAWSNVFNVTNENDLTQKHNGMIELK
jgi:hypothetical protein